MVCDSISLSHFKYQGGRIATDICMLNGHPSIALFLNSVFRTVHQMIFVLKLGLEML